MARFCMGGNLADRHAVKVRLRRAGLHTVCEEARCPNMGECFAAGTATFLILGEVCTRGCRFCAIEKGRAPRPVDLEEPSRVAQAVAELKLAHAVITSVTRDDLPDGGAGHFAACIRAIRTTCPATQVEVLIPDFAGAAAALEAVLAEAPAVLNHNIETVPRLYPEVRAGASFDRSLGILARAAAFGGMVVKSGLMVGLGETDDEVGAVLADLARAGCRVVTIGQYLRPRKESLPVRREVPEGQYEIYRAQGRALGLTVVAGTLVRSSYHAREVLTGIRPPAVDG